MANPARNLALQPPDRKTGLPGRIVTGERSVNCRPERLDLAIRR
jgi:hypothetical protein